MAPGDLNHVFFSTGGGEAVETAFKLAKQYWKLQGKPGKHKVISRYIAYHGTPQGALAITGLPAMKAMFEPITPGGFRVPNTNYYRAAAQGFTGATPEEFGVWAADRIEEMIQFEGPDTIAAVFLEPVAAAVAMANLDIFEEESLLQNVRENSPVFRSTLEKLTDLPIVGDVRGDGYFFGIELVKDKATKATFDDDESERLLRGFLSGALYNAGLYCRADDRGDPVIQLAPPLTTGPAEFDEIEQILRGVLTEAWSRL